ncbi:MAG TPA: AAA family ATPase, partial [Clostridia bacterium]|nr:AAA family ATPase [Clostridia bacterium]
PICEEGGSVYFANLDKTIIKLFDKDVYDFCFCNPAVGLYDPLNRSLQKETVEALIGKFNNNELCSRYDDIFGHVYMIREIGLLADIIKKALVGTTNNNEGERKPVAVVVNFASKFFSDVSNINNDEMKALLNILLASLNSRYYRNNVNTLILVVEKFNDLPTWFYYNNPKVKTVTIPNPDRLVRTVYIEKEFTEFNSIEKAKDVIDKLVSATEGLKLIELRELRQLHMKNNDDISNINETVSAYKYGIKDNLWQSFNKGTIERLERYLKERIIGQDYALNKAITIIKRAVMGMTGLQHSSADNKPRGVLFLAGPTGTGKTELAKAITVILFGDERNCIRFDMAEFSEPHSDQKLIGAPPGYVGYEAGGQLTNEVRKRPYATVLFDEMDKACPTIMDKFLEILEDGRLTDGQGNTVYFSGTLIIFTSNYGYTEMRIDENGNEKREWIIKPGELPYEEVRKKVVDSIKKSKAMKPEIINRIGEHNIIVFDFISKEAAEKIIKKQIKQVNEDCKKQKGISMHVLDECYELLNKKSRSDDVMIYGGRGIGTLVENEYINPLSNYLFDNDFTHEVKITAFVKGDKLDFREEV